MISDKCCLCGAKWDKEQPPWFFAYLSNPISVKHVFCRTHTPAEITEKLGKLIVEYLNKYKTQGEQG
jgi:hypothetical protein